MTKKNDGVIKVLESLRDQEKFPDEKIYEKLFLQITPENFRKFINHALANQKFYINKNYFYFKKSPLLSDTNDPLFLACTYETYRADNGELVLLLQIKRKSCIQIVDPKGILYARKKLKTKKEKGSIKQSGTLSIRISSTGISEDFTLVAKGEYHVKELQKEKIIFSQMNKSPFIQTSLFGEPRYLLGQELRMSVSSPKARHDGDKIYFNSLEELLVGIKSLALGVQHNAKSGWVHQDLKRKNILLMPDGIIKITDFSLAVLEKNSKTKGKANGTSGIVAPEVLADIVEKQRKKLLRNLGLQAKYLKMLEKLSTFSLKYQIKYINHIVGKIKVKVTSEYRYHFLKSPQKSENQDAILLWDYWQDPGLLKKLTLPNRQQDIWSFAVVVLALFNQSSSDIREKPVIRELKKLILDKIWRASPLTRMNIDDFISEFDNLLETMEKAEASQVNLRIEQCKKEFWDAQKFVTSEEKESKTDSPSEAPTVSTAAPIPSKQQESPARSAPVPVPAPATLSTSLSHTVSETKTDSPSEARTVSTAALIPSEQQESPARSAPVPVPAPATLSTLLSHTVSETKTDSSSEARTVSTAALIPSEQQESPARSAPASVPVPVPTSSPVPVTPSTSAPATLSTSVSHTVLEKKVALPSKLKPSVFSEEIETFLRCLNVIRDKYEKEQKCSGFMKVIKSFSIFVNNNILIEKIIGEKIEQVLIKYGYNIHSSEAQTDLDNIIEKYASLIDKSQLKYAVVELSSNYKKYISKYANQSYSFGDARAILLYKQSNISGLM